MMTAKLVSKAIRLSSKANADAVAASRLQGALAGEDDNPLFLGGIRVPPAEAITDAMGTAIATGVQQLQCKAGFLLDIVVNQCEVVKACLQFLYTSCSHDTTPLSMGGPPSTSCTVWSSCLDWHHDCNEGFMDGGWYHGVMPVLASLCHDVCCLF